MQLAATAVFLTVLIALFAAPVERRLRSWFHKDTRRIFLVPLALTGFFAAALATRNAAHPLFIALVAAYTLAPSVLVYLVERSRASLPGLDFAAILLLWLPVEFTTGKNLLPPDTYRLAVILGHGTAVALGLFLFLVFRNLPGMKYNPPGTWADVRNVALGFLAAAPVLIFLGLQLSFLGPFRVRPDASAAGFARIFLITLAGVGLPEELLFRALIQNRLMQQFGFTNKVLLVAALIFGAAHLNNPPGTPPNWRYMLLAAIAGFIYGKVFQKSSTILASASLHALVNTVRHVFFG